MVRRRRCVRRLPGAGERGVGGRGPLDADVDPQHGAQRKFSSDRAIGEYCDEIWQVAALPVD
jgi:hypothetical protein